MTEDIQLRSIVEIDSDDAVRLCKIARTLGCSNTKALQFAIDDVFGIQSLPGTSRKTHFSFREAKSEIGRIFIPMNLQQRRQRMRIEHTEGTTFVSLCSDAIRTVHKDIENIAKQEPSQALLRYLPRFTSKVNEVLEAS
jgi:hypothetical protein